MEGEGEGVNECGVLDTGVDVKTCSRDRSMI